MNEEYIEVHQKCTKDKSYPIHKEITGVFHLDSCDSHGGCVAAGHIEYCPYCGLKLEEK